MNLKNNYCKQNLFDLTPVYLCDLVPKHNNLTRYSIFSIGLARLTVQGLPYATTFDGIFFTTLEPAPIFVFLPIFMLCITALPMPIEENSPNVTCPPKATPGLILQYLEIIQS